MKKKYALVTGANRGIGETIALELIKKNIYVIGTATTKVGVQYIKKKLKKLGTGIILNFLHTKDTIVVLNKLSKKYKIIDILVHNAGFIQDNLLILMKNQEWHDIISINLSSAYYLSKLILPNMIKNKYGKIIIIGSIIGQIGGRGQTNYAAAKSGLSGFVKSLALEVASRNITVNLISPGYIKTRMINFLFKNASEYINKIPMKRLGTTKDIANVVLFLISSGASYITGQNIHVNGGLYMA